MTAASVTPDAAGMPAGRHRTAPGRAWRLASFAALLLVPTLIELALAERKFGIFGGGFGVSRTVDGAIEWLLFLTTFLLGQLIAAMLIWRAIAAAHGRRWSGWLFVVNAGLLATGVVVGLIAARYELMRYFSDALSFHLVRQLGGGSLLDAALYVLEGNGSLLLLAAVIVTAVVLLMRFAAKRDLPLANARWRAPRAALAVFGSAVVLVPVALAAADRTGDVGYALNRFVTIAAARSVLAEASDFDRDGYGAYSMLRDPAPFDAARYPMALDVPGNGIDEDGIGGDFTSPLPPAPQPQLALPARPMNLIVIVIETLRGDVLGTRIGGKPVAPNLEALARGGFAAPAYSHVGFTTESLKSLFTGALVPKGDRQSLFRELKAAGYRVGVISGQAESFGGIDRATGMLDHADPLIDAHTLQKERATAFAAEGSMRVDESRLIAAFDRHFGRREAWAKPVFLYVNFQSPHFPYWHEGMGTPIERDPLARHEIVPENRERLIRTYWNAVGWADLHVGLLLERLQKLGVLENSLILVTGDHGESLFDDGFLGHGHFIGPAQNGTAMILNRPLLKGSGTVGLSDYRAILVDALSNRAPTMPRDPVLLYVGDLDAPTSIGMVEGGRWTVFEPEKGDWRFAAAGPSGPLDRATPEQRARAVRLVQLWSNARWLNRQGRPDSRNFSRP